MKKKLKSSFFGNMIIKPEGLYYHISPDFYAPFAAAGGSHVAKCERRALSHPFICDAALRHHAGKCEEKASSHRKNLGMSTEGAYSKLLPLLFEMPQGGIMSGRLKENINRERMPLSDSFNLFYLWQYRKPVCGMQWV